MERTGGAEVDGYVLHLVGIHSQTLKDGFCASLVLATCKLQLHVSASVSTFD